MAFENVFIRSTKTPPGSTVTGWRQDLAAGDVVVASLTNNTGVSSYRWLLVGRPEGSVAGGAGPEPIAIGTGASASFVVDSNTPYPKDGTYIVHCILNEGTPSETRLTAGMARLSGLTTADGRPLRMMGGFEVFEDTSDATVRQGYNKMLERWLRYLVENVGSNATNFTQMWSRDNYYAPGIHQGYGVTAIEYGAGGALTGAGNTLWGIMEVFGRSGTITDIAGFGGNPTTGSGRMLFALYDLDPAAPTQPTSLVHSFECTGGGFNNNYHEGGLSIPVVAGQAMWFVLCATASPNVDVLNGGALASASGAFANYLGGDYAPVNPGGLPVQHSIQGIKKSFTYAYPPPDPFPALAGGTTDLLLRSFATGVPHFMYKFRQT